MPCTSSISVPSYQAEVVGTTPDPGSRTRPQASSQSRTRGLRLSWPNAGDKRRSRVGKSPVAQNYPQQTRIVHVSSRDLQMHYHFNSPTAASIPPPILEVPLTAWNPANLNTGEQELLHHFQSATSRSLAIVGYDPEELGDALIRITLASNTPAATAVLRSLLALASLHRDGMQTQAVEFKIAALKALAAPSASTSEPIEAIQRVAAGMLLVSFETHQSSCTSADWTLYLGTVKDVIKAADFFVGYMDPDLAIILDWVYYHDVLARFSLRHWHKDSTKGIPTWDSSKPEIFGGRGFNSVSSFPEIGTFRTTMSQLYPGAPVPPHLTLLELMSEVCDAVSAPRLRRKGSQSVSSRGSSRSATTSKSSSPTRSPSAEDDLLSYEDNEHKSFLQILDWRIRTLSLFPDQEHNTPASDLDEAAQQCNLIAELYQLSTLIYLSRASEGLLFSSASTTSRGSKPSTMNNQNKLQSYITKAFSVLPSVKSCPRQFPVFILGAEAHSDENRALILDLISRTEKGSESRSFNHVRVLLQAIWAQHDLSNDGIAAGGGGGTAKDAGQWGYWDKMSYVISCCRIVPSFV